MTIKHVEKCFVCSKDNPLGLRAHFFFQDGQVQGEFTPNENHQGPRNLMHGGLISALLDEAMSALIITGLNIDAATASLEVRFKNPARINEKLIIKAKLLNQHRRMNTASATVEREDGTIVAEGKGKFFTKF
ncbi:MAG: PaaI family thioesterase [Candidatus Omnitrophica bacterium]|nr:PaaI family thioesterase [Candidatus Omnitrophota bacterium]